ncbi:MAG: CNNM domain-containing protein [Lacipirellulaceae bacterium]
MIVALVLFTIGLMLSAFFSGTETGFYRMTRLRLVIDGLAGDWASKVMLWLANQPSLFIATALVGNNLANYLTSLAVVMGTQRLIPGGGTLTDLLAPIVIAPVIFVLGELMPKNLFYDAPNRLLRRCAPALVACCIIFLPATILLWALSQVLKFFSKATPQELSLRLARREISQLVEEGHEAGLLRPVQRTLAQSMLGVAARPISSFATAATRSVRLTTDMKKSDALRLAQRHRRTLLPVEEVNPKRKLVGYIRVADLFVSEDARLPEPLPMLQLEADETYLSAMHKFSQEEDVLGHVVDDDGTTVGFVTGRELRMALFRAEEGV